VTHRDERWFEHPEEFLPERWMPSGADGAVTAPTRFSYFPFGAGPRSCIGEHFARRSIEQAVATILRDWRITPDQPGMPRPRALLTLKPRGTVPARVVVRSDHIPGA
jgi:cytochrome P450